MSLSKLLGAITALAATLLASACSGADGRTTSGQAVGGSTSSVPNDSQLEVPQVQRPLDVSRFVDNPCKLVDQRVIERLGDFDPGKPDVTSDAAKNLIGPRCSWFHKTESTVHFGVSIGLPHQKHADPERKGLAGIYGSRKSGRIDYFQPVTLPGHEDYPAVIAADQQEIDEGSCPVYIGVANDLTVIASFSNGSSPEQACPAAQQVASAVLDTLKSVN